MPSDNPLRGIDVDLTDPVDPLNPGIDWTQLEGRKLRVFTDEFGRVIVVNPTRPSSQWGLLLP